MDRVDASGRFVVVVNELDIVLGNVMLRGLWMEKNFLFQGTKGSKHYQREQVDILLEDSILENTHQRKHLRTAIVRRRESAMDVGKRVISRISALKPTQMEMVARMGIITIMVIITWRSHLVANVTDV